MHSHSHDMQNKESETNQRSHLLPSVFMTMTDSEVDFPFPFHLDQGVHGHVAIDLFPVVEALRAEDRDFPHSPRHQTERVFTLGFSHLVLSTCSIPPWTRGHPAAATITRRCVTPWTSRSWNSETPTSISRVCRVFFGSFMSCSKTAWISTSNLPPWFPTARTWKQKR